MDVPYFSGTGKIDELTQKGTLCQILNINKPISLLFLERPTPRNTLRKSCKGLQRTCMYNFMYNHSLIHSTNIYSELNTECDRKCYRVTKMNKTQP